MIPLQDVVPARTRPVVTLSLMAAMALAVVGEWTLPGDDAVRLLEGGGVVPASFEWHDLLTAVLLHAAWLPALANVAALWIFGENVEDRLGHGRFLLVFLACGVAGFLVHARFEPASAVAAVGPAAAVAGVIGAHVAWFPRGRVLVLVPLGVTWDIIEVPSLLLLAVWLPLQSVAGWWLPLVPGAEAAGPGPLALVGGFAAGALTGRLFGRAERARIEWYEPSGA